MQRSPLDTEQLRELEESVHDVLAGCRRNPLITEEPLVIAGPVPIEAETNLGRHHEAHEVRPHGSVHVQHKIEIPASEFAPDIEVPA